MKSPIQFPQEKIIVYLRYGNNLQKLIGKESETLALPPFSHFDSLLFELFNIYPMLLQMAVPGTLKQKINGAAAELLFPLQTGDFIELDLITLNDFMLELKEDIDKFAAINLLSFNFESIKDKVYLSEGKDFDQELSDEIKEVQELSLSPEDNEFIMNLLWRAWSSLPRKELGGKSMAQKIHSELVEEFELQSKKENKKVKSKTKKNKHEN